MPENKMKRQILLWRNICKSYHIQMANFPNILYRELPSNTGKDCQTNRKMEKGYGQREFIEKEIALENMTSAQLHS